MYVRAARTKDLPAVRRLHHDAWVDEGFLFPRLDRQINRHPEFDADSNTRVLVAIDGGSIVGTNSVSFDGPMGLPVGHGLEEVIDGVRRTTDRLAAAWRIATAPNLRSSSTVIRALMLQTIRTAIDREAKTCLFLFHTRHVPVYRRLLRAKTVMHVGQYYDDAPTWDCVLMRADASDWGSEGYRAMLSSLKPRAACAGRGGCSRCGGCKSNRRPPSPITPVTISA